MSKELEAIDSANPSEALYELKRIDYNITYLLSDCDTIEEVSMCLNSLRDNKSCEVIKQALLKAQKEHKALEIIKKKTVDIWLIQNKKTLKQYNSMVDESRQLTQEEFELLRSVLE